MEQYAYKREYFLVDWLEQVGFRKLISLLRVDDKDNFYVHGLGGNFFRLANFIDKMQWLNFFDSLLKYNKKCTEWDLNPRVLPHRILSATP